MRVQADEWWNWDFEMAWPPEQSAFGRGSATFIKGEAAEFLTPGDPRLLLGAFVRGVAYGPGGVEAHFAVCTFSEGVLQSEEAVTFDPLLPRWNHEALEQFQIGIYAKIFMQSDEEAFWGPGAESFLYVDARDRGYYPVFQSPAAPSLLGEDSNALFVTVVGDRSYRVERQPHEATKAEESYSNWLVGMALEKHQNLRANVSRLHFAGEGASAQYFGLPQGAWFEGRGGPAAAAEGDWQVLTMSTILVACPEGTFGYLADTPSIALVDSV
ncbi:hypothetical protein DL770_007089 [Monosporascus sp. CRB-9-2]|nr:hypothetical protein DL770_007089 [Monosporascus sp. CRB-9-2]